MAAERDALDAEAPLVVRTHWRDRLQYGIVLPVLMLGGVALLAAIAPAPPTLGATLALAGGGVLAVAVGVGFGLTAWRSRLVVGPSGLEVRRAVSVQLVPYNRLERIEVGHPHRYAGRHGRGPAGARVHATGQQRPLVVPATNRSRRAMPQLVAEVDAALAPYGHRVERRACPAA